MEWASARFLGSRLPVLYRSIPTPNRLTQIESYRLLEPFAGTSYIGRKLSDQTISWPVSLGITIRPPSLARRLYLSLFGSAEFRAALEDDNESKEISS